MKITLEKTEGIKFLSFSCQHSFTFLKEPLDLIANQIL